jgi:hypothetical protein
MDWIDLAENRDKWRALVNKVIIFGLHTMENSCVAERLAASQGLSSMELVN